MLKAIQTAGAASAGNLYRSAAFRCSGVHPSVRSSAIVIKNANAPTHDRSPGESRKG